MIWSVIATRAGTGWSTVFIVGEALTVQFEALRLAAVAWFVLAFYTCCFLLFQISGFYLLQLAAILGRLYVFLEIRVFYLFQYFLSQDRFV